MFRFIGYTPLMRAVEEGHLDTAELLIKKGADVNVKNSFGKFFILLCKANLFLFFYENILTT